MSDWFQYSVIAFIILTIGWQVLRTGQANPESTGTLGQQLNSLDAKVGNFDGKLAAIKLEVDDTDGRLKLIEQNAAKTTDIKRLEKAVGDLQGDVSELSKSAASREATLDHVKEQVDRMYRVIVERGMSK